MFNTPYSSRMRTVNVECTVDAQEETIYTCPANCQAHMSLLFFSNVGGTVTVDVEFDRADGTHQHIVGGKNMGTGEYVQFSDGIVVMEPGDVFHITANGATPHVDAMVTVEEFFLTPR